MKEQIFHTIWMLQEKRRREKRAPDTVTKKDLISSLIAQTNQALMELEQEGRIQRGPAPNQDYYKAIVK